MPPGVSHGRAQHRVPAGIRGEVGRDRPASRARACELALDRRQPRGVAADEQQDLALRRERRGDRGADAAAGAGQDGR